MRLIKKERQHRRDFTGVYECEHCDHRQTGPGYDDEFFHQRVIPGMACKSCGLKSGPGGPTSRPDVPAGVVL